MMSWILYRQRAGNYFCILDLSKVFDLVLHAPLLQKLLDIRFYTISYITTSLKGSSLLYTVNGVSSELEVTFGVPQGSIGLVIVSHALH